VGDTFANIFRILESSKYSDLTITCQGQVFKVHRTFVCPQSKPLAAHVESGFRESITGEIKLDHDHPEAVHKMISFFYTQNYTLDDTSSEPLLSHTRIYITADKYDVPLLKRLASENYKKVTSEKFDENLFLFIDSLKMICDETPESDKGLRDVAIKAARDNLGDLMETEAFVDLLKENPDISVDILKVASQPAPEAPQPAAAPQLLYPGVYIPHSNYLLTPSSHCDAAQYFYDINNDWYGPLGPPPPPIYPSSHRFFHQHASRGHSRV
jgi:hypothetical protein